MLCCVAFISSIVYDWDGGEATVYGADGVGFGAKGPLARR